MTFLTSFKALALFQWSADVFSQTNKFDPGTLLWHHANLSSQAQWILLAQNIPTRPHSSEAHPQVIDSHREQREERNLKFAWKDRPTLEVLDKEQLNA